MSFLFFFCSNIVVGIIMPRLRRKKAMETKSNENHNLHAHKNIEKITINKRKNEWFDGDPLAGFIFLCSGETKSEGYKKGIFGLPYWELDTVKKIKEGANLFLYDIDLRLLYGIYEATSDGGYCLDPSAFGGMFHAQVKFKIVRDCLPLCESASKNAIRKNYEGGLIVERQLTDRQVSKLIAMFCPIDLAPHSPPIELVEPPPDAAMPRSARAPLQSPPKVPFAAMSWNARAPLQSSPKVPYATMSHHAHAQLQSPPEDPYAATSHHGLASLDGQPRDSLPAMTHKARATLQRQREDQSSAMSHDTYALPQGIQRDTYAAISNDACTLHPRPPEEPYAAIAHHAPYLLQGPAWYPYAAMSENSGAALQVVAKDSYTAGNKMVDEDRSPGFIFLCNGKTNLEFFQKCLFGLSYGRMDVVKKIKEGTILFLYDVDLRLLYGIFVATSDGGHCLEPLAFEGLFPAQVRFKLVRCCLPLPGRELRNEIYEGTLNFNLELSDHQVRKLIDMFHRIDLPRTFPTKEIAQPPTLANLPQGVGYQLLRMSQFPPSDNPYADTTCDVPDLLQGQAGERYAALANHTGAPLQVLPGDPSAARNSRIDGDLLSGFIFMSCGKKKSECHQNCEATSDGGHCLEPSAFEGMFPAQVKKLISMFRPNPAIQMAPPPPPHPNPPQALGYQFQPMSLVPPQDPYAGTVFDSFAPAQRPQDASVSNNAENPCAVTSLNPHAVLQYPIEDSYADITKNAPAKPQGPAEDLCAVMTSKVGVSLQNLPEDPCTVITHNTGSPLQAPEENLCLHHECASPQDSLEDSHAAITHNSHAKLQGLMEDPYAVMTCKAGTRLRDPREGPCTATTYKAGAPLQAPLEDPCTARTHNAGTPLQVVHEMVPHSDRMAGRDGEYHVSRDKEMVSHLDIRSENCCNVQNQTPYATSHALPPSHEPQPLYRQPSTQQSRSSSQGPVAILWDIENCPIPNNVRSEDVAGNIRMAVNAHPNITGPIKVLSAYGDFSTFPRRVREGCQRTGVKLIDVPNGRKDAADKAILVDMFLFAFENRPPSSILLISGDVDFSPALHILGQQGYTVILVIPDGVGVSSALRNSGRAKVTCQANLCPVAAASASSPAPALAPAPAVSVPLQ
ncbi:hypothetical protein GIB67_004077 [Kingdonia uniflora]|uniref:DCD domain-containing protein n=1 Tax=Kingdonia uniflora TaxID=39325 RepID=A0A7J7NR66_9MAGN|nr:hypothetical protein GIB67_004077 [Kingdonia uniflora]